MPEGDRPRRLAAPDVASAFRRALGERPFLVVSNREPYEHVYQEASDELLVRRPAGGLVAALDPVLQAVGGTWIAWGSGDRDQEATDSRGRVRVPPEDPSYTLRRLWLTEQDIQHYYYGYSNQFLWPLCHLRPALTRTRRRYWDRYRSVNTRFAEAVLEEVDAVPGTGAVVWFQDYHLAVAPAIVRARRPDLILGHFWHIPFPPLEIFRVAHNGPELLRGLLATDVAGFHLPLFCDNFLRCAESVLRDEVTVDWEQRSASIGHHTCYVRAYPISIDVDAFRQAATAPGMEERVRRLRARFAPAGVQLALSVDRIDYSKGLEEKLKALEILFETHPEHRERLTFVQVAVPSRTGIDAYDWLNEKLDRMVWSINDRFGTDSWRPVHLIRESLPLDRLTALFRAADLCIISSLQDGMNLVAKEFIACQVDEPCGVLVLSQFTGAAHELDGACHVNPYDPDAFVASLCEALRMPAAERAVRMGQLHLSLRSIYDWMAEIFTGWGAVARGEAAPLSEADHWSRSR